MRKTTLTLLVASLVANAAAQDPVAQPHACGHAKAQAAAWMQALIGTAGHPAARPRGAADTDVLHYDLDIEIVPAARWIAGSNTMTVRSLVDDLTTFCFRLHNAYAIDSLTVDGQPANWSRLNDATIEVTLNRPYRAGELFRLRVAYAGRPVTGNGYVHVSSTAVFTISEPWFAYLWWPCKDALADKTTADLAFTVPATMTVASNGVLQGVDDVGGDRRRYRWKTEYPTGDHLYCIGATTYNTFTSVWNYGAISMPLEFFIFPGSDTPANRQAWLKTADMLTTFSDLFGTYPFSAEKYGIYQFSNVWFGGMEHQTMTGQMGFEESTTAHELAHQWWGDEVTCATWHDIWLNEGFATYSEALWFEHKPGSPGAPALHAHMAARRPANVNDSVYCYDISDPNRIFNYDYSYLKAAWVLHMLRHVLGDEAFFDCLNVYRGTFANSAVTTQQFQELLENRTGWDLDWFFGQWVYRPGAPKYRFAWREHQADGRAYLELYVRQGQSLFWPTYTMPIDLAVTTPASTRTYAIWNDARREHLLIPLDEPGVTGVTLDPVPWILWLERVAVSFEEGPPKVVSMNPAPGAELPAASVTHFEIVFHKDVLVDHPQITLTGAHQGQIATVFGYDPQRRAAILQPAATLKSDTYTLTVADTVVDAVSGQALDGELIKPDRPAPLPSGDGLPGGPAVARFLLTVAGDLNCDGSIDSSDVDAFVLALAWPQRYLAVYADCPIGNADINGDGQVNFGDINPFIQLLGLP
mgnify:CR=1 FL=1